MTARSEPPVTQREYARRSRTAFVPRPELQYKVQEYAQQHQTFLEFKTKRKELDDLLIASRRARTALRRLVMWDGQGVDPACSRALQGFLRAPVRPRSPQPALARRRFAELVDRIDHRDRMRQKRGLKEDEGVEYIVFARPALIEAAKSKDVDALAAQVQELRDKLLGWNLRLAAKLARKSIYRVRHLEFDDLLHLGYLGLMRAVDVFDPEKGNRFSTYAMYWIRQSIDRGVLNQDRVVRVPCSVLQTAARAQKIMDGAEGEPDRAAFARKQMNVQPARFKQALIAAQSHVDLDLPDGSMREIPRSLSGKDIDELEVDRDNRLSDAAKAAEKLLKVLDSRSRRVMQMRMDGQTLHGIGEQLGVTRERIRQIERAAIGKMRKVGVRLRKKGEI